MNWIEALRKAIDEMERHLLDSITPEEIAAQCGYSSGTLQRGFHIVTGFTLAEYQRSRRLYLAALDLAHHRMKVIDAALKYGYDSPDAFSRAFRRFHGCTPAQIREDPSAIRIFLPLQIQIHVQGGNKMEYEMQQIPAFEVIGTIRTVEPPEDAYRIIPGWWNEFMQLAARAMQQGPGEDPVLQAIWSSNIGEFGLSFEEDGVMKYMIAGKYRGGPVPEGFTLRRIPAMDWALFSCSGPMPEAIQKLNTRIFTEWLPAHPDIIMPEDLSIEYYPLGSNQAPDYRAQIWIPIQKK